MFDVNSRFLVVDDSKIARDIVRVALSQMDLTHCDEAVNGTDGWDKIVASAEENKPYTLVFCDIQMPEMNGLKLLEKVRKEEKVSKTPFLIITTESSKSDVVKAVMHGVSGYMVKPLGVEDVKKKLSDLYPQIRVQE